MHTEVRMKPGGPYRVSDAPIIERELSRLISDEHGITKEELLEAASDPTSPLHRFLNWDDTTAAHQWRLAQASKMLRSIEICIVRDTPPKEEDWHRKLIVVHEQGESRFMTIPTIVRERNYLTEVCERADREWKAYRNRYRQFMHLPAFAKLLEEIQHDTVLDDDFAEAAD